jgi:hypothetical protein
MMKKLKIDASLFMVFCRDGEGNLWFMHGDLSSGLGASKLPDGMSDRREFEFMVEQALDRKQFLLLHKALAKPGNFWDIALSIYGVALRPDTVFYREISLGTTESAGLLPPNKQEPAASTKKHIKIVGATCHYKTNTITLVGATDNTKKFVNQIHDELWFKDIHLERTTFCGVSHSTGLGPSCAVQFQLLPGPKLRQVVRHLLGKFK